MKRPPTASKAAFAKSVGIGKKQIDRHVREGVLNGRAVIREGRTVRINSTIAKEQLADRLAPPTSGRRLFGAAVDGDKRNRSLSTKIKSELLTYKRRRNRKADRELAAEGGRYVLRADADRALERISGMTLAKWAGGLH